ncbi:hypothetical protein KFL_007390070 [Klebsormidium nitens]|uniref:AN1-type domain-containing protein n=1 Tax=Klebsormidium nitens TaxID=105231 RepID=A0A1Y1IKH5_KLENI|nr:hypothetical protein KFL_007390070 [Klebsormidium nitens]|eukprot:GAQ91183.1 hypothetical protein KFL_007390070 [Klebsormidium nitens]
MSTGLPGAGNGDDLDVVLQELQIDNSVCADKSCKKNVILLGQVCKLCKLKFCLTHGLPEAHGCGADAKKAARKEWLKTDGNTKPQGSAQGSSKDWHRPYLAKKLKDQVDQKSFGRRKGAPEGKPKK